MEALNCMLDVDAFVGQFSGFSVGSSPSTSLMVSHLLFADDTLIFYNAGPNELATLKVILTRLKEVLGLRINLEKSELVLVGEVHNLDVLVGLLGCRHSSLPLKYLGPPLGTKFKKLSI